MPSTEATASSPSGVSKAPPLTQSATLNDAEAKFFTSRGADVDPSLTGAEGAAPPEPEAAPPAAAAPPPAAAPTPAPAPAQPEPQQVPLAALHEERRKRAEVEAQRHQLAAQIEQFKRAMQQAQAPQPPDPEEDPVGYLSFQNQQLQAQVQQMAEWRAQQERERQQQTQYATLTQTVAAAEQSFRAKTPDYDQAAQFALQMEDKRLSAFYPDQATRMQVLRQEAAQLMSQLVREGRDPAEGLYQMAKNLGYAGPAPAPVAAPAAPAAPPAPAPAPVAAVVETIEKGLKQQAVGSAGGTTASGEVTPEMMAAMNDPAEFNKAWAKFARSARR